MLVFNIGADDSLSESQLPDVRKFPRNFLIPPNLAAADYHDYDQNVCGHLLGEALGIARIKLCRGFPPECYGAHEELDGQEFIGLPETLHALEVQFGDSVCGGYNLVISTVLEMALHDPERLPTLLARLDSIGNDDLHRLAMGAIQGHGDDNLHPLSGLFSPREVAHKNPGEKIGGAA